MILLDMSFPVFSQTLWWSLTHTKEMQTPFSYQSSSTNILPQATMTFYRLTGNENFTKRNKCLTRTQTSLSTNFGGKLSFILPFLFSWAPPLLLHIFSVLRNVLTIVITLEPCALNAEFQHFILRFNKTSGCPWSKATVMFYIASRSSGRVSALIVLSCPVCHHRQNHLIGPKIRVALLEDNDLKMQA